MKIKSLLLGVFIALVLYCPNLHAQKNISTKFADRINYIFQYVDKSKVPHGLLLDYAMEFADLKNYSGALTDSNYVYLNNYRSIYNTLVASRVRKGISGLYSPEEFRTRWNGVRKADLVTISGLYYRYSRFSDDALTANKLSLVKDQFKDKYVNGVWQNPYTVNSVFAMSAPIYYVKSLSFEAIVPENIFFSNDAGNIARLEIDFGDGNGYRQINFNAKVRLSYSTAGRYTWTYKLTLKDQQIFYSHSLISVSRTIPTDTITGMPEQITATRGYNGAPAGTATIELYDFNNDGVITRPVIIAEGFDGNIDPENDNGDTDAETFAFDIARSNSTLETQFLIPVFTGSNMTDVTPLYDIIYVNWDDSFAPIQSNAFVLEAVINTVNAIKTEDTQNIVWGQSMGGLVARYALKDMENLGQDHDTKLYISHDSPHRGANVPVSLQFMMRHIMNDIMSMPLGDMAVGISDDAASLVDLGEMFGSDAAKQMLIYYINEDYNLDTAVHDAWLEELDLMGYPELTRNVAVSNGGHCAEPQDIQPMEEFIKVSGYLQAGALTDLVLTMSGVGLGVITENFMVGFLGVIPGGNNFDVDFWAKALPLSGIPQIYRGKLTYRKKILYLVDATETITEVNKNAPANLVPLDHYPGGYYEITVNEHEPYNGGNFGQHIINQLVDQFLLNDNVSIEVNPYFDFIPTPSALDVGQGDVGLVTADYFATYNAAAPPAAPKNIPFNNFTTTHNTVFTGGDIISAGSNEKHISINPRNGNWLNAEINDGVPNQVFNCSFSCTSEINGPAIACNGSTFSLPAGFDSYTWSIDAQHQIYITITGQSTRTISVSSSNYSGPFTLSVVGQSGNCGNVRLTKEIYLGVPAPNIQGIYCASVSGSCYVTTPPSNNYFMFTLTAPPGSYDSNTTWEWQKISGNFDFLGNGGLYNSDHVYGQTANLYLDGANPTTSPLSFKVRMINECDSSPWRTYTWNDGTTPNNNPGSNGYFTLSPNPAISYLNVTMTNTTYPAPAGTLFPAEIYAIPPIAGALKTTTIYFNGPGQTTSGSFNDLSGLAGTYLVRIYFPNGSHEDHEFVKQ